MQQKNCSSVLAAALRSSGPACSAFHKMISGRMCKYLTADVCMQAWDLNGPAPEDLGKGYDLVMACNTLHTGTDIAGGQPLSIAGLAAAQALMIVMPCCVLTGVASLAAALAHAAARPATALVLMFIMPCCALTRIVGA